VGGILLILGALALVLMVGSYLFYEVRLRGMQSEVAQIEQQISQQQRLNELAPFRDLQDRLQAKKPVADGIYASRFDWPQFLQALAFVIPENASLNALTAQATPIDLQGTEGQTLQPPGTVTFTGLVIPGYRNLADFVLQMNDLQFLTNTSLDSAELDRETLAEPVINFEVSSELLTTFGENGTEVPLDTEQQQEESQQ
jgi:Tfp pilus assembly protein PilN